MMPPWIITVLILAVVLGAVWILCAWIDDPDDEEE
jgi:hypothetical protein